MLYRRPEWPKRCAERRRIDGHRCVDCGKGGYARLSVDHEVPLRVLWREAAGDLGAFLSAALDVDRLRLRCASCHKLAEDDRNR
jgi:5-methylcytosine-specific restriction endonuclease McrA